MHEITKIGILGGGQLARMIMIAGSKMNFDIHFLDADPKCSVSNLTNQLQIGDPLDFYNVINFGMDKDIISIETEKVNIKALKYLEKLGKKVYPKPDTLEIVVDKGLQKMFYAEKEFNTSRFWLAYNNDDIKNIKDLKSFVLKKRKGGYDGKGVLIVENSLINIILLEPSIVEERIDVKKEISIIGARNPDGEIAIYEPVEMIVDPATKKLDYQICPARLELNKVLEIKSIIKRLLIEFDYVGILAVELFLNAKG
ncbi:MAG: ATP-grasp domain-containing protein, partial [Patescibacteria group bacterium]